MKRTFTTIFLFFALYSTGFTQLRTFTYQGDYKFKTRNDFDSISIFAFPEKWIESNHKWILTPAQVTITFNPTTFGFTTPTGHLYGVPTGAYQRTTTGHKFKVQIRDNQSPYNGDIGDIVFITDKNGNWTSLNYYFPGYLSGTFILAKKMVDLTKQKIEKYKSTYVSSLKRCIEIANDVIKTEDKVKINKLKQEGKQTQAEAWNAFLLLQDPELKFPYEKIKSMTTINPIFFGEGVFSDERILKLDAKDYKGKVQEQIEKINSALPIIEKF